MYESNSREKLKTNGNSSSKNHNYNACKCARINKCGRILQKRKHGFTSTCVCVYIFLSPFSSKRNRTINRKFTFNGVIVVAN